MARDHCEYPGCHKHLVYKWIGPDKVHSRFCQDHTCQWRYNSPEDFCQTQRHRTNKCCPTHGKCRIPLCNNQAPRAIDANTLPWICPQRKNIPSCLKHCYRFIGPRSANSTVSLTQKTSKTK